VAFSNEGDWQKAAELFETVISSADRYALPWWLRYSMSLLETSRGMESVAFLQRTLNRFPDEAECKAYAAALYTSLGASVEAKKYWNELSVEEKKNFATENYLVEKVKWGPVAIKNLKKILTAHSQ
jgi:tetratricopeptide (TPR) repeat protein